MQTYKGRYIVKNIAKYKGDANNVTYRSLWEKQFMKWCDSNSKIIGWNSESIIIPYLYDVDQSPHRYFVDFKIELANGKVMLIEIKPKSQMSPPKNTGRKSKRFINESLAYVKNQNKWEAATKYAKQRGWTFHVFNEHDLRGLGLAIM